MTDFPESGVKLVADTSSYTDDMQAALDLADQFDSVGSIDISLNATADTSEIDSMQQAIDEIEAAGGTVDFNVEDDDNTKGIFENVRFLANMKTLETIWNIAGTAVDLFGKFADYAVSPMLDLGDAVAKVNAQTGNAVPNARELIKNIFYDDLGDSIGQVGDMVTAAAQMHVPIDDAVRSALTFTHTFQDQDPQLAMQAMDQMVKNNLAPDFKSAGDMISVAFQNGANRGHDLLTTINSNAGAIADLGLTGPQAMQVLTSGLAAGFDTAQSVLDTLIKIKQNVTAAAGNQTSNVTTTLQALGIANPADTGGTWSLDFFQSVIDGIKNAPVGDADKMAMFSNLLGGKVGSREFSNLMRLSPEDWANAFNADALQGASDTAAQTVDDSLRGAIDDFSLAADLAMQNFLSSDQIDLPGKIEALKTGLQDGLDVLAKGGTLGDALTIALKPIGFDDEFQSLESALGNFIIGILQAVASIQDLTGHGDQATGTRATIAGMAKNQLTFDLKVGNPDQVSTDIATAVSRGVTPDEISKSVGSAVSELVSQGAIDQAQALLDAAKTGGLTLTGIRQGMQNFPDVKVPITPDMTPEEVQAMIKKFEDGLTNAGFDWKANVIPTIPPDQVTALQQQISGALSSTYDPLSSISTGGASATPYDPLSSLKVSTDALNLSTTTASTNIGLANVATDQQAVSATQVANAATAANLAQSDLGQSMAATLGQYQQQQSAMQTTGDEAQLAAANLTQAAGALSNLANTAQNIANSANSNAASAVASTTPVTGAHAVGTDNAIGTFMTGEHGRELVSSNRGLAVLNNQSTEAIMSALNGFIPGASGARAGASNYQLNQTNIVQSMAQADALGYSTAKTLRGMG